MTTYLEQLRSPEGMALLLSGKKFRPGDVFGGNFTGEQPSILTQQQPQLQQTQTSLEQARNEEISLLEQQLEIQRQLAQEQLAAAQEQAKLQEQQQQELASILEAQTEASAEAAKAQQQEAQRASLITNRQRQRTALDYSRVTRNQNQQSAPLSLLTYSATERR